MRPMPEDTTMTETTRIAVTYCPDQDACNLLATWGPDVDRRREEITARLQVQLGPEYEVELDSSVNARSPGATQKLRLSVTRFESDVDHEQIAEEALREAWSHCTDRWDRETK